MASSDISHEGSPLDSLPPHYPPALPCSLAARFIAGAFHARNTRPRNASTRAPILGSRLSLDPATFNTLTPWSSSHSRTIDGRVRPGSTIRNVRLVRLHHSTVKAVPFPVTSPKMIVASAALTFASVRAG